MATNVRTAVDRIMPGAPARSSARKEKGQVGPSSKATENKAFEKSTSCRLSSGSPAPKRKPVDFAAVIARATKPPVELARLVDVMGPDATLKLLDAKGGTRVYVPKPYSSEVSNLEDIVGAAPAQHLREALGGRAIRFPTMQASRHERTVDRLLRVLEKDVVDRLVAQLGGSNIYVPSEIEDGCPIARALGVDAARRVRAEFGPRINVRIPTLITERPTTSWDRLVDIVGEEAALRLREFQKGRVFRVPPVDSSRVLAGIIGSDAQQRFSTAFGGEHFQVPIARAWRCRLMRLRGWSIPAIASRLAVTERAVGRMLTDAGLTGAVWRHIQHTLGAAPPASAPEPREEPKP